MLLDKVVKYYDTKYDLNCAEAMVYAANEEYNLNLSKDALRMVSAFGGGMGVEITCGVITGAASVLGILFVKERGHESTKIKELTREFITRFEAECNSINCDKLKELHRTDEARCSYMMEKGAVILENIILSNK